MSTVLSARLRHLRNRNGWTVADMAERTGIPKRTLDKYMLRSGASLPGFDALCSLSKGLGVSLDWLVFGSEGASKAVELMAYRAAYDNVLKYFEMILREKNAENPRLFIGDRILNMTPEDYATDIGSFVAEQVRDMVSEGVTLSEMLEWERKLKERSSELFKDLLQFAREHPLPAPDVAENGK